jgi:hypothetical protein
VQITIRVESPVIESPRVLQVRGLFDLPAESASRVEWKVRLPLEERPWLIGLITGPSGSGKTTIARRLWPAQAARSLDWPAGRSILDAFPEALPVKEITALLSSVGFSSPPGSSFASRWPACWRRRLPTRRAPAPSCWTSSPAWSTARWRASVRRPWRGQPGG